MTIRAVNYGTNNPKTKYIRWQDVIGTAKPIHEDEIVHLPQKPDLRASC